MKPAFAMIDWDFAYRPVCCYMGPDEIPWRIARDVSRKCRKSRFGDVFSLETLRIDVEEGAENFNGQAAVTSNTPDWSLIRIWTYSDTILAHEILHVIEYVSDRLGIRDEEFRCYALQWLLCDLRTKLTGRFQNPVSFRRDR